MAQLRDPASAGSSLVTMARWGMAVAAIVILALLAFLIQRRRK